MKKKMPVLGRIVVLSVALGLVSFVVPVHAIRKANSVAPSLAWPLQKPHVTLKYSSTHHGIDYDGTKKTNILAVANGTVEIEQCGWNDGKGCMISIAHENGLTSIYEHLSKILVKKGDVVTAGQIIGHMGNTGRTFGITGITLHYELQKDGVPVDPNMYTVKK